MSITGSEKPQCISASPRSCMSMNWLTWVAPSTAPKAARSSVSVSGPSVENITMPSGFSTRWNSANTLSGTLTHWIARLDQIMSTLLSANGRRSTSAHSCHGAGRRNRRPSMP
ncbi:hypothetical protein D3C78_1487960 [compost metagenome]